MIERGFQTDELPGAPGQALATLGTQLWWTWSG